MFQNNSNKEAFEFSELEENFINAFQYSIDLKVPLSKGETSIKFALLWEGDTYDVVKDSAKETPHAQDMLTRTGFIKRETLVEAIFQIGETKYYSENDPDENKSLKNKLRVVLSKSSPKLVDYIYQRYYDLTKIRDNFFNEQTAEYQKKFEEEIQNIKPL